ncbi:Oxidase FUB9 [Pseudocercospora fuligena]|uniref:Oxidase FUB9 n=1 Tax=Pseudocercospora fuligena TaxID=685502 RepID=A0A8H6VBI2_9PEZI|nr:Oxidase FUB9 [Pseudocercospora fuligena]
MYRDYYNEGAMDLITLKDNEAAFDRYRLKPRVLVNVENIDLSSEIMGVKTMMPLGFSPAAMHLLAHADGEIATSRAAAKYGLCMGFSTYSTSSLEDVAAQGNGNPLALQLSVLRDRRTTLRMIKRAERAGYKAIFLTVDVPMLGRRLNEYRNDFSLPEDMSYPNLTPDQQLEADDIITETPNYDYDPSLEWDSAIAWIKSNTSLQVWLKGVTSGDDVELAIRYGIDGILVSNHGGRQLDGQPASLDALRECSIAAAGRIPIAMDGGIRRGSDIFKAIALGASHVFVGRIPIWGLAYNGQAGVELAIKILMSELKLTMGLCGCRTIKDISRQYLTYLDPDGVLAKL